MFHKATKSLAEQLDPEGDFIPVRCLLDQSHFGLLYLVQKRHKAPWWQKLCYYKTGYKLQDVLQPGQDASQPGNLPSSDPLTETFTDICDSDTCTIEAAGILKGEMLAVPHLTSMEIKGSASISYARSVTVKKWHINAQVLDSLNGKSKINLDHPLIKQCEKFRRNLYVISETVETMEAAKFTDSSQTEGSILAELQLKMKITGLRESKKAVTIPKGSTLAFRVKLLIIRDGTLSVSLFPFDKTPTFIPHIAHREGRDHPLPPPPPPPLPSSSPSRLPVWGHPSGFGHPFGLPQRGVPHIAHREGRDHPLPPPLPPRLSSSSPPRPSVGVPYSIFGQPFEHPQGGEVLEHSRKFQLMQIEEECIPFLSLSIDLRDKFLNGFLAIIRNNDLLEELEFQLEQALDGNNLMKLETSRPELQEMVNNLQDSTGSICPDIAGSVLYFLQALDELSEAEFSLLEESMERKIVPKQTALVQCILEDDSDTKWKLLKIHEVSPFTEDELDITLAMIKLCGMTVDRSIAGPFVTGSRDVYLALGALYVALYVLNILTK